MEEKYRGEEHVRVQACSVRLTEAVEWEEEEAVEDAKSAY
jgi:hypothetical protein